MPFSVRSVGYGELPPGGETEKRVVGFAQLIWTLSGTGKQWRNGKSYQIEKDYICCYLPRDEHCLRGIGNDPWRYYWLTFDGPAVTPFAANFGFDDLPYRVGPCPESRIKRIEQLLDIPGEAATREPAAEAFQLLLEIASTKAAERSFEDYPEMIRNAIRCIRTNISNPALGVDFLAEEAGIHRSSFYRTFLKVTGTSPKTFIDTIKANKAKDLLRHSDLSIEDVAHRCGFKDANYFGKFFNRNCGCTPSSFRITPDF